MTVEQPTITYTDQREALRNLCRHWTHVRFGQGEPIHLDVLLRVPDSQLWTTTVTGDEITVHTPRGPLTAQLIVVD